jgi:hypothetical protein
VMMTRSIVCAISLVMICCQNAKVDKNSFGKQQPSASSEVADCQTGKVFNTQDSMGVFRGVVVDLADTSQSMSQGLLQLAGGNGDTVIFHFDYDQVTLDMGKLPFGTCAEISYYAEIQRVEVDSSEDGKLGDEISRHFYIKEIRYLN